jgi:hypothetical protein
LQSAPHWGDDLNHLDDESSPIVAPIKDMKGGTLVVPPPHKSQIDTKGIQIIVTSYHPHPANLSQLWNTVTKVKVTTECCCVVLLQTHPCPSSNTRIILIILDPDAAEFEQRKVKNWARQSKLTLSSSSHRIQAEEIDFDCPLILFFPSKPTTSSSKATSFFQLRAR